MALNPDCCSARRSDDSMAETAPCTSTTTPFRIPCDGQIPTPRISGVPLAMSAISVQTLVVPTSIPTMIWSAAMSLPPRLSVVGPLEESNVHELRRRAGLLQVGSNCPVGRQLGLEVAAE